MIGFLIGLAKNMMFVGYSIVNALLFMWVFNYFAPFINVNIVQLPVTNLSYWQCFSLFILIHFIGGFIKRLSPFSFNVNNSNKTEEKNN